MKLKKPLTLCRKRGRKRSISEKKIEVTSHYLKRRNLNDAVSLDKTVVEI